MSLNPPIVFDYPIPEGHTKDETMSAIVSCKTESKTENWWGAWSWSRFQRQKAMLKIMQ